MNSRKKRVNLSDLIRSVAKRHDNLQHQDVEEIAKFFCNRVISAVSEGRRVEIRSFGSFSRRMRQGYLGRNPRSGEKIYISSRPVLYFKAGKELRQRVNIRR